MRPAFYPARPALHAPPPNLPSPSLTFSSRGPCKKGSLWTFTSASATTHPHPGPRRRAPFPTSHNWAPGLDTCLPLPPPRRLWKAQVGEPKARQAPGKTETESKRIKWRRGAGREGHSRGPQSRSSFTHQSPRLSFRTPALPRLPLLPLPGPDAASIGGVSLLRSPCDMLSLILLAVLGGGEWAEGWRGPGRSWGWGGSLSILLQGRWLWTPDSQCK